jgi:hypothetical protein
LPSRATTPRQYRSSWWPRSKAGGSDRARSRTGPSIACLLARRREPHAATLTATARDGGVPAANCSCICGTPGIPGRRKRRWQFAAGLPRSQGRGNRNVTGA